MIVAGIDEAGRGPVVGPMVLACVAVAEDQVEALRAMGVRDSKKIAKKTRERIAAGLRSLHGIRIEEEIATPEEIDAAVTDRSMTLNGLELSRMARLIDRVRPDIVHVDMVGASAEKQQLALLRLLDFPVRIIAAARAEDQYPAVAAASILAKTRRDQLVAAIEAEYGERYGPVGSGYPGDAKTVAFVRALGRSVSGVVRRTWGSACVEVAPASAGGWGS